MCRAAKLTVSGTKSEAVEHLLQGEFSSKYSFDCSIRNATLKEQCREKGLQTSGKRFDFVLRLLQDETGAGGEPKRAAGEMDENGVFHAKKRAKSMKLPNLEKLTDRAYKKAFPSDEVQWKWSNWTSKQHCTRCIVLACDIITKEIFEKELFDRGEEKLAWQVIDGITRWFVYGLPPKVTSPPRGRIIMLPGATKPRGMGYASRELKDTLYPLLVRAMQASVPKGGCKSLPATSFEILRQRLAVIVLKVKSSPTHLTTIYCQPCRRRGLQCFNSIWFICISDRYSFIFVIPLHS